jgi:hypothetical protein
MPKAKKPIISPDQKKAVSKAKKKPRGRSRKRQRVLRNRQRSRSVDGKPPLTLEDRAATGSPPPTQDAENNEAPKNRLATHSEVCGTGDPDHLNQTPEIQELRGSPDPTATITGETFKCMGHELQSNLRRVFLSLDNALGRESALDGPRVPSATTQLHRCRTRAAVHDSKEFLKSLLPRDKVPEKDEQIEVRFEGATTIRIDAPGYSEIIAFECGAWSRTRNGVKETGKLDGEEGARIAEQLKQVSDGMMQHAARSLAGVSSPAGSDTRSPQHARSPDRPNDVVAPPTTVSTPLATSTLSADLCGCHPGPLANVKSSQRNSESGLTRKRDVDGGRFKSGTISALLKALEAANTYDPFLPRKRIRMTAADMF